MQPSLLSKFLTHEEKIDYFFILELFQEKIKAASCKIEKGEVEVLQTIIKEAGNSWEETTLAIDEALSRVEENFPPETTVNKVILGLPTEYTKDGKIEETHLSNIRELCRKLSLVPLGFVEVPLAITYFLQRQEGGPQTLILVRLGQDLAVSLVRVGKITNNITVPKTENIAYDLEKALASFFGVEVLPSKILLYDGGDLENIKQTLMNYPWPTKASFLHFPKIEVAETNLDLKAVALAGGSEISQTIEVAEPKEIKEETTVVENGEGTFGFVKNRDILQEPAISPSPQETVASFTEPVPVPAPTPQTAELGKPPRFNFPKIKLSLPNLSQVRSLVSQKIGLFVAGFIFLLLLIAGGGLAAAWYYPTATINIILEPKTLEQEAEITLNPKATVVNESNQEIPGLLFEIDEKGTKKINTTGKKIVGDPAKGEVTLYNKTLNGKTFAKGIIILSPNNLKFTLDEETIIASASESVGSITFGKQNAHLTAEKIGPEGNLGIGQEFRLADFPTSSYSARNETAFSGGTSREISVVSRNDQEKLIATLASELTEQAKKDLQGKINSGEKFIEKTLLSEVKSKKFDKEADQEATDLNGEINMHFSASGYKEEDLLAIVEKTIAVSVPSGFEFKRSELETEVAEMTKKKDGNLLLKVNFSASLLPKIDETEIKKNLTGKNLTEADKYLRNLGNLGGYEIKFGRQFPLTKGNLPRLPQNILIETSSRK